MLPLPQNTSSKAYNTAVVYLQKKADILNRSIKYERLNDVISNIEYLISQAVIKMKELAATTNWTSYKEPSFQVEYIEPQHSAKVHILKIKNDDPDITTFNSSLSLGDMNMNLFLGEIVMANQSISDTVANDTSYWDDFTDGGGDPDVLNYDRLTQVFIEQVQEEYGRIGYGVDEENTQAAQAAQQEAVVEAEGAVEEVEEGLSNEDIAQAIEDAAVAVNEAIQNYAEAIENYNDAVDAANQYSDTVEGLTNAINNGEAYEGTYTTADGHEVTVSYDPETGELVMTEENPEDGEVTTRTGTEAIDAISADSFGHATATSEAYDAAAQAEHEYTNAAAAAGVEYNPETGAWEEIGTAEMYNTQTDEQNEAASEEEAANWEGWFE